LDALRWTLPELQLPQNTHLPAALPSVSHRRREVAWRLHQWYISDLQCQPSTWRAHHPQGAL